MSRKRMRLIFAGTPDVSAKVLERLAAEFEIALVITRPDAALGRRKELQPSAVARSAADLGLEILKTTRIDENARSRILDAKADFGIVVAFGSLIPKVMLEVMPWWNLHFSLLPLWRGASPLQYSLIANSGKGVTLFQLDEGLDTGPIISSQPVEYSSEKNAGELLLELGEVGSQLIIDALEQRPEPKPQLGEPTYAPKIERQFAKLDFSMTAKQLEVRIRAFNPEPVAWCIAGDTELRVLRAKAIGDVDWGSLSNDLLVEGELEIRKNSVLVVCGNGTRLELLEVQPAGKRVMTAVDWARGYGGKSIG